MIWCSEKAVHGLDDVESSNGKPSETESPSRNIHKSVYDAWSVGCIDPSGIYEADL